MLIDSLALLKRFILKSSLVIEELNYQQKQSAEEKKHQLECFSQELVYLQLIIFAIYFVRVHKKSIFFKELLKFEELANLLKERETKIVNQVVKQISLMQRREKVELAIESINRISFLESKLLEDGLVAGKF